MEEEEEEEEEEDYEDDILQDAGPHMLIIERTRTDDSFVGRLSKFVFQRAPSQDHISLTYHQEITLYIRYHILPLLREILYDSRERFFIWLASCAEYYKDSNNLEICQRWSSFRNENWYSPILDSRQECEDFILAMTDDFVTDMTSDVEQMANYFGSSWQFLRVKVFHLRFVKAAPHNLIRFGVRPKQTNSFHPEIQPLFRSLVLDPEPFALAALKGCCVPISIILSVLIRFHVTPASDIGKKQVMRGLNSFNFQHLLQPDGINLSDFGRLESANTPLSQSFLDSFPSLSSGYKGLALNLFRAVLHKDEEQRPLIYIFPSRLSPRHEDTAFLQIDLLLDSPQLRPEAASPHSRPPHTNPLHVLAIPDLIKLLARNDHLKRQNSQRYTEICRRCCSIFSSFEDLNIHRRYIYLLPTIFSLSLSLYS